MSATVTVNLTGFAGGSAPGAVVQVQLMNCSNPRVVGSGQLVPLIQNYFPVNGVVTLTLYDNSQITCGPVNVGASGNCGCNSVNGTAVSYYCFSFIYQGAVTSIGCYNLSPGTFNLWDLHPCQGSDCIGTSTAPISVNIITQTPLGVLDGTNVTYTLLYSPTVLWLQLNGIFLTEGIDYTLVDNVLTMTLPPPPNSVFTAIYTYGPYVPEILSEVPAGAVNGSNTVFTTTKPISHNAAWLYVNGVYQTLGVDYTVASNVITFTLAPPAGSGLFIEYISASAGQTYNIISTEIPTGLIDGTNTVFNLSKVPGYLMLQQNQGLLQPGVGYTRAGSQLTLAIPPSLGDVLYATLFN